MAKSNRDNIGMNYFMKFLSNEESFMHEAPGTWEYARNAINASDKGDKFVLSSEPSNKLCTRIYIENQEAYIVGMVYLYDDKWCVFSTLNKNPLDNKPSEIGIFDKSTCQYVTVIRDTCLNFSKIHAITGVSRLGHRQNYYVYWSDGHNPDRVIDLGNYNLWPKNMDERGDPTIRPWLDDIVNIPYITFDSDPSTDCYEAEPILPLSIDCNKLSLTPKIKIPRPVVKKGRVGGTLPNGIYSVAIAYSKNGENYGNWFVSPPAHVFSSHENPTSNSIEIYIDEIDTDTFETYLLAIIYQVNGQVKSYIVGEYDTKSNILNIGFIDESTVKPISLTEIFTRRLLFEKSDYITSTGSHLVRVSPTSRLDFNYQPLANLIETRWFVAEYPERYYYDLKTAAGDYRIEADVVQYLRDEVYTFYIRWVYNTGEYSSFYHIPAPPFNIIECEGRQINNAIYKSKLNIPNGPDGGVIIAEGYPGVYYSDELYDCRHPERWNWTHYKENVIKPSDKAKYTLPYGELDSSKFDLCCKRIRLHWMPDETIHEDLYLYNSTNQKIRNLGIYFKNIYHPLDNEGNQIKDIVGFEIWRGVRGANRTIIAKGVLSTARGYDYIDETLSNDSNYHNSLFEAYPCDDNTTEYNPFLSLLQTRTELNYGTSPGNSSISLTKDLDNRDTYDLDTVGAIRYKNKDNIKNGFYFFHSPEITMGYPYLNAKFIKLYGDLKGVSENKYLIINNGLPKAKIVSPNKIAMLIYRSTLESFKILNGGYEVRYGGHDSRQTAESSTVDLATAGTITIIKKALAAYSSLIGMQFTNQILPLLAPTMSFFNSIGLDFGDIMRNVYGGVDVAVGVASVFGGANFKHVEIIKKDDGLLNMIPKGMRVSMFLPLYLMSVNEVFYTLRGKEEQVLPFQPYALNIITHNKLHNLVRYNVSCDKFIGDIYDSFYLRSNIYSFTDVNTSRSYRINHLFRTPCVFINSKPLIEKLTNDNSLINRIYNPKEGKSCCNINSTDPSKRYSNGNVLTSCVIKNDGSLRYVGLKVDNNRPYSQLYSIRKYKIGNYTKVKNYRYGYADPYQSEYYFGGDTYVTRYTEKDRFNYFNTIPINQPDGFEFNYPAHRHILHPRFWINTEKLNLTESISSIMNTPISGTQFTLLGSIVCSSSQDQECLDKVSNYLNIMSVLGYNNISNCRQSLLSFCKLVDTFKDIIDSINAVAGKLTNITGSLASWDLPKFCNELKCTNPVNCFIAAVGGIACFILFIIKIIVSITAMILGFSVFITSALGVALVQIVQIPFLLTGLVSVMSCLLASASSTPMALVKSVANYNLDGCIGIKCTTNYSLVNNTKVHLISDTNPDEWMYLSNGIVRDFFIESQYNMAYRMNDMNVNGQEYFDPYRNSDYNKHFDVKTYYDTDIFIADQSMNLHTYELIYSTLEDIQPRDYSPIDAEKAYIKDKRMVIYSLPIGGQFKNHYLKKDMWRIFLPNNIKVFEDVVTGFQDVGGTAVLVYFKHSPPMLFPGVETFKTNSGRELIVGAGGLFEQTLNRVNNAQVEYQYASMKFKRASLNTPYGLYFISSNTGRIYQYAQSLNEITLSSMKLWSQYFIPEKITEQIEGLEDYENPALGITQQIVFDNKYTIVYFIKRDYKIKDEYKHLKFKYVDVYKNINGGIMYKNKVLVIDPSKEPQPGLKDHIVDTFYLADIDSKDNKYVEDISWTLSYDPHIKGFISFHDWHPDFAVGSNNTFITTKGNGIWVHNERCDSYCNFYGIGYNFEVDFRNMLDINVKTLRSIEYIIQAFKYNKNCQSQFHVLDYNFDKLVVYNTEQCSGICNLIMKPKNNPFASVSYPQYTPTGVNILYEKVENKYRVNGFVDLIRDRGEYSGNSIPFLILSDDGYNRFIDSSQIDYSKSPVEHKRFRHYVNNIWLIKEPDNDNGIYHIPYKIEFIILLTKLSASIR
ncbi:MAG: hypothetical protein KatS3mg002_1349 [Candidatus Woesearchaeota archaeon]|nr:MAG: hypothetical protein KatS3mg002_1349 [Candidatus Woesearchaeota archaeon]